MDIPPRLANPDAADPFLSTIAHLENRFSIFNRQMTWTVFSGRMAQISKSISICLRWLKQQKKIVSTRYRGFFRIVYFSLGRLYELLKRLETHDIQTSYVERPNVQAFTTSQAGTDTSFIQIESVIAFVEKQLNLQNKKKIRTTDVALSMDTLEDFVRSTTQSFMGFFNPRVDRSGSIYFDEKFNLDNQHQPIG